MGSHGIAFHSTTKTGDDHFLIAAAAAAAKSRQSCPTLCGPIDGSPPGSPVSGIFQATVLEWVAIAFSKNSIWGCKFTFSLEVSEVRCD